MPICKVCNAAYRAEIRAKDPEKSRAYFKDYNDNRRVRDPVADTKAQKEWRQRNPGAKRARRKIDPQFRICENLRRRVSHAISSSGSRKSAKTKELLGCPWVWLEVHLESLFKLGMTWENYGTVWHVDHIKPCAKFNLLDPEQQRICFHWTNLQPLFAKENMQKSDKFPLTK